MICNEGLKDRGLSRPLSFAYRENYNVYYRKINYKNREVFKMKKYVFTKTFNNENELNDFVENNVGNKYYWNIRPQWINIDGLTMTIAMRFSNNFYSRKRICDEHGFIMKREES